MLYLDEQERRTQKWEIYAARIIASIRSFWGGRVSEEDCLVKYSEPTSIPKKKSLAERTKEAYAHTMAAFGIDFSKVKKGK
jgi:hypothetical protein